MKQREAGLLIHWNTIFTPDAGQCIHHGQKKEPDVVKPLDIKSLTGAFIVLGLGSIASLIAFFHERLVFNISKIWQQDILA